MLATETVQFETTPEFRQQLDSEAAKLHLSISAYIYYLHARLQPGQNAARLDRHIREVFGRHGELMRKLAK